MGWNENQEMSIMLYIVSFQDLESPGKQMLGTPVKDYLDEVSYCACL